jgi:hypothetical protein
VIHQPHKTIIEALEEIASLLLLKEPMQGFRLGGLLAGDNGGKGKNVVCRRLGSL